MSSVTAPPTQSYDPHDDLDSESDNASGSKKESELHAMTEVGLEESQELLLQPNQPRLKNFPSKQFGKSKVEYRSFNFKWFNNKKWSAWLHWNSGTEKAYCFVCQNVYLLNQLTFSKCAENAFILSGFNTWKNATKSFERHRKSACYQEAVLKWHHHLKQTNIGTQIDQQISKDKKKICTA